MSLSGSPHLIPSAASVCDICECASPPSTCFIAGETPSVVKGDIKFTNVHFAYPTRRHDKILSGFSLEIAAGKTLALVGPRCAVIFQGLFEIYDVVVQWRRKIDCFVAAHQAVRSRHWQRHA